MIYKYGILIPSNFGKLIDFLYHLPSNLKIYILCSNSKWSLAKWSLAKLSSPNEVHHRKFAKLSFAKLKKVLAKKK